MSEPGGQPAFRVHRRILAGLAAALSCALFAACVAVEEPPAGEGSHVPAGDTASDRSACAAGASEAKDLTAAALAGWLEDKELAATGPVVTRYTRDGAKLASQTFRVELEGQAVEGTLSCRSSCQGAGCRGVGCVPAGAVCSAYAVSDGCGGSCTRELVLASRLE